MIIKAENKIKNYKLTKREFQIHLFFLKEFNQEYRSYCYIKNIFIFENDSRLNYIILQKDPFLYEYGTFNGVIGGIDNGIIYAVANSKVEIYKIDEDFINFQNHVFNNEKCEIQEKFRLRAISFYESLNMNDKALEICNNKNLKFEILVKSKKLNEAFEYCETPYMYEKLGELFFSINDYDNAALCFYNSKNWKRLFHVDMINKKNYLNKTAENLYKNGDLNYAFLAYMKLNDYEKCGELLQESKFYNIFKKTFLNK
ncbi:coatomer beta prime subunit [Vairimorpha apis BRL 01]|uniref:Coatomer beta prime subunit n=1 Tax=Vairimorpha apis BRL 01 TaxID=1037528 RepID=T0L2A1_9MICR|nr:coatomer beta prime subunit [Vairimorpha apis BRL 01]